MPAVKPVATSDVDTSTSEAFFQEYLYAPVWLKSPPLTVGVIVPSLPSLQLISVATRLVICIAVGSVILALAVAVHSFASVTVTT